MLWLMGEQMGIKEKESTLANTLKLMSWVSVTWRGSQKRLMWFFTIPTKSNNDSIYIHTGPPSKKFMIPLHALDSHATSHQGRGWGNKEVTGPSHDSLCQSPLSGEVKPWMLGSVLGGRATGWLSNLVTMLILASCFSASSYGVQDKSCCSLYAPRKSCGQPVPHS